MYWLKCWKTDKNVVIITVQKHTKRTYCWSALHYLSILLYCETHNFIYFIPVVLVEFFKPVCDSYKETFCAVYVRMNLSCSFLGILAGPCCFFPEDIVSSHIHCPGLPFLFASRLIRFPIINRARFLPSI